MCIVFKLIAVVASHGGFMCFDIAKGLFTWLMFADTIAKKGYSFEM